MNEKQIPEAFLCPIGRVIMKDPVFVESGHTFQRQYIQEWFATGKMTNPMTNHLLSDLKLRPNFALKQLITTYQKQQEEKNSQVKQPKEEEKQKKEQEKDQPKSYYQVNNLNFPRSIDSVSNAYVEQYAWNNFIPCRVKSWELIKDFSHRNAWYQPPKNR